MPLACTAMRQVHVAGQSALARLRPRSLRTDAADVIRAAIVGGELPEGARVNESQLAARLGISRGPIREALRALELEGRLVARPNYGTYVASFTLEDVIECISVRELIEPYAIQRAIAHGHEALIVDLRHALAAMRQAAKEGDRNSLVTGHDDFHGLFYVHAQHRLLHSIWERVRVPLRSHVRLQEIGYERPDDIPHAHEPLMRLVEAKDGEALRTEVLSHLRMNVARFAEAMSSSEPPATDKSARRIRRRARRRLADR